MENKYNNIKIQKYKLHDAMKIVLLESKDYKLHASEISDIIYERKLYFKKDGSKAKTGQIRARAVKYSAMFEVLPENYIKLNKL